jgi:hypothetical protein
VVSTILRLIVELFVVLIDVVGPLLAVHEARWNMVPVKCGVELTPEDLMVVLECSGVSSPLGSY